MLEDPAFEISEDGIQVFGEAMKDLLRENFNGGKHDERRRNDKKNGKLYASSFGLPPRRLWFSVHGEPVKLSASDRIRFLYGHILESLVMLFAEEAGHNVTEQQKRVSVGNVSGKKDGRIDGVTVDVKSASSFSFKKFAKGEFLIGDEDSDPFGYKYQIGLYMKAGGDDKGAFVVINKENGEIVVNVLDKDFDVPDVEAKIEEANHILEHDHPPEGKCYPDVPRGKSGNYVLHKLCTFCDFRDQCWADANDGKGLFKHQYADGATYFTRLVKDPQGKKTEEEVYD
jgi:hypothetical protein